jgi:hypothetical protein
MAPLTTLVEAVARYQQGAHTFSELAAETGWNIEQIMDAVTTAAGEAGIHHFLARCRAIAEAQNDPEFYRLAEAAARSVTGQSGSL